MMDSLSTNLQFFCPPSYMPITVCLFVCTLFVCAETLPLFTKSTVSQLNLATTTIRKKLCELVIFEFSLFGGDSVYMSFSLRIFINCNFSLFRTVLCVYVYVVSLVESEHNYYCVCIYMCVSLSLTK